ncbi:MAG: kelch repeat-containing protein [Chitinophagales bacterium]
MKKHLLLSLLVTQYSLLLTAQTSGEWTWMSGDSIPNSSGIFGTQGISDLVNKPPGLYQSCSWTDHDGNFWLFGGANFTSQGGFRPYNTLWKYTPATNEWIWMKGSNAPFSYGVYGILGVPDNSNNPGARYMTSSWVDSSGNLWLFGGYGNDNGTFGTGILNDLWKYSITTNEWTWMKGANSAYQQAVWGQKQLADSTNTPGGKAQANSWTDANGDLWLFGGFLHYSLTYYNDLWRYNIATNEWTWMKGDSLPGQLGSFGTLGIADSTNNPSARTCQAHWVDSSGNLWLFGGYAGSVAKDDLWQFLTAQNNWVYWGGTVLGMPIQNDGILCLADTLNHPPAREQCACVWNTGSNFWMFGGYGSCLANFNIQPQGDVWKLFPDSKMWIRVNGEDCDHSGIFGQQGISSPVNRPASRFGSVSWQDTAGNFYVFGGTNDLLPNDQSPCFNDLWRYVPDSTCGVYTEVNEIAQQENQIEIYPNPASDVLHVKYSSPEKTTLTIFNHLGTIVMRRNLVNTNDVDVSLLPQGMYLITVCADGNCYSRKLVIMK